MSACAGPTRAILQVRQAWERRLASYAALWRHPRHPYTRALLAAIPSANKSKTPAALLAGEVNPGTAERGCRFRMRCPVAVQRCETDDPPLRKLPDGHAVACHLA